MKKLYYIFTEWEKDEKTKLLCKVFGRNEQDAYTKAVRRYPELETTQGLRWMVDNIEISKTVPIIG